MPFQIVRNDITRMQVDAIVNTANPLPGYGAGIDTAVYKAAGEDELYKKRLEIGAIERGQSVITDGYKLPAKYIIHTVGTRWHGGNSGEEDVIRSCYKTVFKLALDNNVKSLAIPLLASGCYGFPKGIALRIAFSEIEAFLASHDMDISLVVFDEKAVSLSAELYGDIDEYINDHYVEKMVVEEYGAVYMRQPLEPMWAMDEAVPLRSGKAPSKAKKAKKSLDDVIGNLDKSFMELVFTHADDKGITDVELQKKGHIDRRVFSKLKCGTSKNPSISTALAFAVALELNLDEARDLLSRAGLAFSSCNKRDIIVQYFIEKGMYSVDAVNCALHEYGEETIGNW